jgi:hypothetical protein
MGNEIVKYFGRKTGKELMAEKSAASKTEKKTSTKTGKKADASAGKQDSSEGKTSSGASSAMKSSYVPPPPTPRVSVPQIRQEIQRILDLNKQIRNVHSGGAVQIQRVQEQARIHQQILTEIEASQRSPAVQEAPVKTVLLAQEKMRIIHEDAQRNAKILEALKSVPSNAGAKVTPKVAPKANTSAS